MNDKFAPVPCGSKATLRKGGTSLAIPLGFFAIFVCAFIIARGLGWL